MSTPALAKAALRHRLLLARADRADRVDGSSAGAGIAAVAARLPQLRPGATVSAYVSVGTEPPTRPLLDALRGDGVRVLLPVLAPGGLEWAAYEGHDRLRPGPYGLLEPCGQRLGVSALAGVDLVLAPALAVDGRGHRLGRGGGHYDRALAAAPGVPVLAVVYDEELLAAVPVEPHDRPVTGAVTPTRLQWVEGRA